MRRVQALSVIGLLLAASGCDGRSPVDLRPDQPGKAATARSESNLSEATVFTAAGDLSSTLATFRFNLGVPVNATPGPHPGGRREINWDGVPAALTNVDDFPGDFFNSTDPAAPDGRKRGLVTFTDGTGFRVSDNDFADIDPSYGSQFRFFTPQKTFAAVGSTLTVAEFRVPGTDRPALVNGFGVVFSDVDHPRSTRLEFYDADDKLLGRAWSPARVGDRGHTFVGAVFPGAVVKRVHIISGKRALGPGVLDGENGVGHDLVVMDDFFYGEPQGVE